MAIIISILYTLIAVAIAVALVAVGSMVFSWVSANHDVIVKDLKIAAIALLFIGILIAVALSPAASRAEELPDGFYYKVVFIDEVEEVELDQFDIKDGAVAKFLLHIDDLDHLWDYWDVIEENEEEFIDYAFDKDLSDLALYWARENDIEIKVDKEERITRGRIVVLTMWECDPEDPFDEEACGVYYSEFITW